MTIAQDFADENTALIDSSVVDAWHNSICFCLFCFFQFCSHVFWFVLSLLYKGELTTFKNTAKRVGQVSCDTVYGPEEVVLAVDVVALREALVAEVCLAVGAFETARVPRPILHLQNESVKNRLRATSAHRNGHCTQI